MLSCIVNPKFGFLSYLHKQTNLTRKEASTQAYNHISSNENRYLKQACQSDIHITRTIAKQGGSHNRFDCLSKSSVRAVFALNLAITRLRWSRWWVKWGSDLTALIPNQGELTNEHGSRIGEPFYTRWLWLNVHCTGSWAFDLNATTM